MNKRITVYERNPYDDIPNTPEEFLKFFNGYFDQVPEEYRDTARVEFDADTYYDGATLLLEIWYERPETPEEEAARIAKELAETERLEQRERATLEALKAKYEK